MFGYARKRRFHQLSKLNKIITMIIHHVALVLHLAHVFKCHSAYDYSQTPPYVNNSRPKLLI